MKDPKLIGEILFQLEKCVNDDIFIDLESSIIEFKDLSSGSNWKALKIAVCAFLNSDGGYIFCGVHEKSDKSKYILTDFNKSNEPKLVELRDKVFKDDKGNLVNLSENIFFSYETINDKTIAIIEVYPLSKDLKFVNFNDEHYERVGTAKMVIDKLILERQKEYKAEIEYFRELRPVSEATLNDLDIYQINKFIYEINKTGMKETTKVSLVDAADFLFRRHCIDSENRITTLGMLLFGKEPFQFLEKRAEIDCYYEMGNTLGKDKKFFQDDVLSLMDDAFNFIWGHIKIGRTYVGGGQSEPEYPEKLIREVINNAVAHRDYTKNEFITIKIKPNENLEIKNPGTFKSKMLIDLPKSYIPIRRIIPGIPETKNPKLANILKVYDKIESQGVGMATLVSLCLENQIDVPYYDLYNSEEIKLVIPSGELLDSETIFWLNSYETYIVNKINTELTFEHKSVLAYLFKSEKLNKDFYYTVLFSRNNNHFKVLKSFIDSGIVYEHPEASTQNIPVYILNRELVKNNFTSEIEELLNVKIDTFDRRYAQRILNIIYRYNYFNHQAVKPVQITPELYSMIFDKKIDPKSYESVGRSVRKVCETLWKLGYLLKNSDKKYFIKGFDL